MKMPAKHVRMIERALLIVGAVLLAVFLGAYLHRWIMVRAEIARFKEATRVERNSKDARAAAPKQDEALARSLPGDQGNDVTARPPERDGTHEGNVLPAVEVPMAILRIPKLNLEVPVLNGTDAITLNRGVGRIAGTGRPGQKGNIGIAGHRDGFFSGLKDITTGDKIELLTAKGTDIYIVDRILITDPDDMSVLNDGDKPMLTLVTCYPFHYVGPAPRRFIVGASLKQ
jgi:sortase A